MRPSKPQNGLPIRKETTRQAKEKEHNRLLDTLVVMLCLFFMLFFVSRFWNDLNQQRLKDGEQPIGTIVLKKKTAQRRFVDRVLWDRLQRESPVYNGDVIRTAEVSEASIIFQNGRQQVINLNENSLIQIFSDENGERINFTKGDISVESAQGGIALVASGKTVNIGEGGIVSAHTDERDTFNLTVVAGDAWLVNENGILQTASAGSGFFYNPDGTLSVEPRALIYAPKPDVKIITSENAAQSVEFLWNTTNYTAGMTTRIEFAADRNFRTITRSQDFPVQRRTQLPIPVGTTYWRAYPVSQTSETYPSNASTGKLSVTYAPPPRLISPQPEQTVTYRAILPSICYQWSATDDPISFRLVIADNPGMDFPVATTNVQGNAQVMPVPGEGTWYWRVEPVYPQGITGVSAVSAVSSYHVIRSSGTIPAPALMLPNPNSVISVAPNGPDTYFSWKGDDEAVSYNIVVSRNADLAFPAINADIADSYYAYTAQDALLQTGSYYWAVTQTDANGMVSPPSQIRVFQTSYFAEDTKSFPAPVAVSPREGSRVTLTGTPVEFRWRPVSGADGYSFTLYRIDEGVSSPVYETDTDALSVPISITSGNYAWTVQAMGKIRNEGPVWAGNITEQRFTVRNAPSISLVFPANGSTINRESAVRTGIRVNWTAGEPLRTSRFILSRNPDPLQGTPVMDIRDPGTSLVLLPLNEGTYYWTVLGETEDNYAVSARLPARFQVSPAAIEAVALVSPANGTVITMAEARKAGIVQWTSTETPARSRFVLSRNPNPLAGTPILDMQNPPRTISLPTLEPGDYYWTITGTTADGFDITARSPSMFRIHLTTLPAVNYILPANGAALKPEEIRDVQGVVFRWEAVQGANEYIFTLWKDGPTRETLIAHSPTGETSFKFDNLNKLAEGGAFVWQVTARFRDENGHIERDGTNSESRFTVTIPRPGRGEAYPPGILYGR
jgi:hypothetical protein